MAKKKLTFGFAHFSVTVSRNYANTFSALEPWFSQLVCYLIDVINLEGSETLRFKAT